MSTCSLPEIPTWLGIQHKTTVLPFFKSVEQSIINLWIRSSSILKPLIAWRLDMESEKDYNFLMVSRRAYSSALKMLAVFGSRTHLVLFLWTTACNELLWSNQGRYVVRTSTVLNNSSKEEATTLVTSLRTIGVDVIEILVAATQFIKWFLKLSGGVVSLSEQWSLRSNTGRLNSHGGVATVVDCATDFFLKPRAWRSHDTWMPSGGIWLGNKPEATLVVRQMNQTIGCN